VSPETHLRDLSDHPAKVRGDCGSENAPAGLEDQRGRRRLFRGPEPGACLPPPKGRTVRLQPAKKVAGPLPPVSKPRAGFLSQRDPGAKTYTDPVFGFKDPARHRSSTLWMASLAPRTLKTPSFAPSPSTERDLQRSTHRSPILFGADLYRCRLSAHGHPPRGRLSTSLRHRRS